MPEESAAPSSPPPRRSVALGIFVVSQLIFLLVQNFFSYLQELRDEMPYATRQAVQHVAPDWPEKKGHLWNFMEGTTQVTNRWSQTTLQLQKWSLFAPTVGKDCYFPALLLSDDEPPEAPVEPEAEPGRYRVRGRIILSDNEPVDLQRYFRFGRFRLRKYENALFPYLKAQENEKPEETVERFRDSIKAYARDNMEMLGGYMRLRLKESGATPPRQVILLMRHYVLTDPDAASFVEGPFTLPFARWQPQAGKALEYFNPVTHHFEKYAP